MKKIKFQAWDEQKKIMHKNFQFIKSGDEGNDWIIFTSDLQPDFSQAKDNPHFSQQLKIRQYIGVNDSDGNEMYDGDIVKVVDDDKEETIHTIENYSSSDYPAFDLTPEIDDETNNITHAKGYCTITVIGNIYENPELINNQ